MKWSLVFILCFAPISVMASPAEEPLDNHVPLLESAQELLGLNINRIANRLDLFFADQRADDELGRSLLRFRRNYEVRERATPTEQSQIRFNLRLPHLEKKFKFDISEKPQNNSTVAEGQQDPNKLTQAWQFKSDVGVSVKIPPNIFARTRFRKNTQTWKVINRFVQELAWFSDRDWEDTVTLDSDYPIKETMLLRFRNSADWKITRKEFGTSHGPSLLHKISSLDAFAYGLTMSTTIEDGTWFVTNFRLAPAYRRDLYRQWLYMDLIPGLDFPKAWSFRRTPFVFLQIEALFGGQ
jgi:hypothetical protein